MRAELQLRLLPPGLAAAPSMPGGPEGSRAAGWGTRRWPRRWCHGEWYGRFGVWEAPAVTASCLAPVSSVSGEII